MLAKFEVDLILFAGHDPGAKNHVQPIYERALAEGKKAKFLDLMAEVGLMEDDTAGRFIDRHRPSILVSGTSMNQGERALVSACKVHGIPTVSLVDISAKSRFDGWAPESLPDQFLLTNKGCIAELISMGVDPKRLTLVGSAHLERIANAPTIINQESVRAHYGLGAGTQILPFFCVPVCDYSADAVESLGSLISSTALASIPVVVRPHPRMSDKFKLEAVCSRFDRFIFDGGDKISNHDLLSCSSISLSMVSTVSLESAVMGVPSAFYQLGWEYEYYEGLYSNIEDMFRIRHLSDLNWFIQQSVAHSHSSAPEVENCWGALDRNWNAIKGFALSFS